MITRVFKWGTCSAGSANSRSAGFATPQIAAPKVAQDQGPVQVLERLLQAVPQQHTVR